MALETFIVGAYTGTWNAVALGLSESGYEISTSLKQEAIDKSDAYGDATLDYIYRGGDVMCDFTMLSSSKAASVMWPWGANIWTMVTTTTGPIGRLASDLAQALVLTSTAGTPAAAAPATLTAAKAIIAPGFNTKMLFDSRLRKVPIRQQFLPYVSASTVIWAVQT